MARTWLSVTVELLSGRGEELWPWPGRVFAVGPSHTFGKLAEAIDGAFARWDRTHLSMFTFADGRIVIDPATGEDLAASAGGPFQAAVDIATARVARSVELGAEFEYTFDLGDEWVHRCTVGVEMVDPVEVLGVRPAVPLAYGGWGVIPDQYGRRWADDDGAGDPPARPTEPHSMLRQEWTGQQHCPVLDMTELRAAVATADAARFLASVDGVDIDDVLQQVATGIPMLLASGDDDRAELFTVSVINRLSLRGWDGDEVLAEDLLASLRGALLAGRAVPVDLDMLTGELEGDVDLSNGRYLDLHSGEILSEALTDPAMVGDDVAVDVDEDPERWLRIDRAASRDGWGDMAMFAAREPDPLRRSQLERAIDGNGAFRRFRDIIDAEELSDAWRAFSTDRQLGRARAFLAANGIRVSTHPMSPPGAGPVPF